MKLRTNLKRMLCMLMVVLTVAAYVPLTATAAEEIKSNEFITASPKVYPGYGVAKKIDAFYATVKGKRMGGNYQYYRGGTSSYAVAGYCHGFVCDVWYNVFGYDMYHSGKSTKTAKQKTFTEAAIKSFITKNGRIGDIVRVEGDWTHSYLIREITNSGVKFYEYGGDKAYEKGAHAITLSYKTLANRWGKGQFYGKKASYYFLYKIKDSIYADVDGIINVSFNANGGTVSTSSCYYQVNKNYSSLPTPTKSGYKFTGWYTAKTGGTKITTGTTVEKGDKTLYAHWSVIDKNKLYYVEYNKNGGTGSMPRIEVVANEYFLSGPNKFTRTGYVFKGWNLRRKSDNNWYIPGKGWKSDTTIKLFNYSKKLFKDNYEYKLDSYWMNGSAKNETFVLYAVWSKCASHKWDSGKITTQPTTTKTGVKTYTCTLCKTTKTETVPKATIVKNWDIKAVEKLSQTDAQIKARVNFTKKVKCTQGGFWFGTDKNNLKKNAKHDSINYTNTYIDMWFLMSKYGQKLSPGKTYYYKFYVIADGKTYYSDVKSFTTKPASTTPTNTSVVKNWDIKPIEKLSQTDAQIKARVNFTKKVKCTQGGFWFGTDKNNLKKNAKHDSINYTNTYIDMWFLMSKYGQKLSPGKTYYYKFYVIADGKTYYSDVKSFTTKPASTTPTNTSVVKNWDIKAVEKLSQTDAQIKARVNFTKKVNCTQGGFWFGTDKNNLKKNAKHDSINYTNTYIDMWFLMSKYGQKLSPGKTYYYKFYVIADGKTYYSDVKSFTTKPASTSSSIVKNWDIKSVEKLSKTDAQIKARVNFTKKVKCTQAGFWFGTDKNNLKKNAKHDSINYTNTYLDMWFLMSKYGQKLSPGKTYYYKFYVIADGKTYYSDVKSFTTKK